MSNKYSIKQHRHYGACILKSDVFSGLWFKEAEMRAIVYDSYMLNMDSLIEYAATNHLELKKYLMEIKDILATTKGVYKRSQIGK